MKHYIYLTEDKLYYIRKENRARGYSFMGSRTITGPETVTGAMESLADIYNLKGRAVVLAIEASVKIHFMSLPASSMETGNLDFKPFLPAKCRNTQEINDISTLFYTPFHLVLHYSLYQGYSPPLNPEGYRETNISKGSL